ncbi:DUF2742 domain-containing protein [Streptomyces sp. cg28]|uniref:DUF2742 domain-containing protein n=1 Tax=Streptomyces sp. cg28 TaxID=3403457 RepID=UPI003B20D26C
MTTRTTPGSPAARRGRASLRLVSDEDGVTDTQPGPPPHDATRLRAMNQITALGAHNWPPYGSIPWLRLDPRDPRVYAATLEAAEEHRIHIARIYGDAYRQAERTVRNADGARAARNSTSSRTGEPHKLAATPGWPPIQIPGRPGEYLTYQETSA